MNPPSKMFKSVGNGFSQANADAKAFFVRRKGDYKI